MKDVAIDRVETAILDFPLRRPHRFARTGMDAQEPADGVARITELAQELAGKAGARVDLDARWDLVTSLRWPPRPAEAGVDLVEQPVPGAEVEWPAEINAP